MSIERPIIMTGESVRAILEGRKSQTRRVIMPQPDTKWVQWLINENNGGNSSYYNTDGEPTMHLNTQRELTDRGECPYGKPGDRLWVRETFWTPGEIPEPPLIDTGDYIKTPNGWTAVIYRADGNYRDGAWSPSIFMPRWASRITLEVVGVRVERLQEISEADCLAEGIDWAACNHSYTQTLYAFKLLWDSINIKRGFGWAVNPWVFVIEFKRVKP